MQRSKDRGHTWETLRLPVVPNTPMWTFAMHAADPNLVLTCSHYGQVFVSEDAGDSWSKYGASSARSAPGVGAQLVQRQHDLVC